MFIHWFLRIKDGIKKRVPDSINIADGEFGKCGFFNISCGSCHGSCRVGLEEFVESGGDKENTKGKGEEDNNDPVNLTSGGGTRDEKGPSMQGGGVTKRRKYVHFVAVHSILCRAMYCHW